jgi:septum site-determining protein MinD
MKELVSCLKESFDYILIDCPAGIEQGFKNALAGADRAIVVVTPEVSSVRDADRAIALMEKTHRNLAPQLMINRYNPGLVERGEMLDVDDIWNILGLPILGVLPETEEVLIASNRGLPVVLNSNHEIAAAFERSARRLVGEECPLHDLHSSPNLWEWIKGLVGNSRKAAI